MGCGGDREKQVAKEHQWGYFNLSDFKSNSCWAPFSYVVLYITLIVSVACYVLDILTCSQLIVSDKWAGQIQISPIVPFEIARWIFTGCIFLSFVFLAYRWWKAIRAIRSGSVVASYLDPLAVRVQSIRWGQAQGWRKFLVFTELTKSKKGAEYVALFSYFSFEAALRIIFAEGPRQVINGITIYSIMRSKIIPIGGNAAPLGHSPIVQFFLNVKVLAEGSTLRAIVFFGMLFTLLIWILAALSLFIACVLYIVFLWHHIPTGDGGLSGYCKRKVDGKLQSIVDAKIKKALAREDKMRIREEAKAVKAGQPIQGLKNQPTLPVLTTSMEDKLPDMPTISRQHTFVTLPEYESRPSTPNMQGNSSYGDNFSRPGMLSRTTTLASNDSYASTNAPLIGGAAPMGFSQPRSYSPAASMTSTQPSLNRSLTGQTNSSQGSFGYDQRTNQDQVRPMGPPIRQNTGGSQFGPGEHFRPAPQMRSNTPIGEPRFTSGPPRRQNAGETGNGNYFGAIDRPGPSPAMSAGPQYSRRNPGPSVDRQQSEQRAIEMQNRSQLTSAPPDRSLRPYSPALSAPGQGPRIPFTGSRRNFTAPPHPSSVSFDRPNAPLIRSGTAPPQSQFSNPSYDHGNRTPGPPSRSATADPSYGEWPQHGL